MTNLRLSKLAKEWRASGSPEQEAFDWSKSRANWMRYLPKQADFIASLPDRLSRKDVRVICDDEEIEVTHKFLSTMIWGYGDIGYGSYRVNKMFRTESFEEVINQTYVLASTGQVKVAYEYLSKNRVHQLGPAFGTKWLSFASPKDQPAPIYDSFISLWVAEFAQEEFTHVPTSSEVWSCKTYFRYYDWMVQNSAALEILPDNLELLIFQDATVNFSNQSKWAHL
jgi:hypothetical protein